MRLMLFNSLVLGYSLLVGDAWSVHVICCSVWSLAILVRILVKLYPEEVGHAYRCTQ